MKDARAHHVSARESVPHPAGDGAVEDEDFRVLRDGAGAFEFAGHAAGHVVLPAWAGEGLVRGGDAGEDRSAGVLVVDAVHVRREDGLRGAEGFREVGHEDVAARDGPPLVAEDDVAGEDGREACREGLCRAHGDVGPEVRGGEGERGDARVEEGRDDEALQVADVRVHACGGERVALACSEAVPLREDVAERAGAVDDDQGLRGREFLAEARDGGDVRGAVAGLVRDDAAAQLDQMDDASTPGLPSVTICGTPPRFLMAAAHSWGSSVSASMLPPPPEPVSFAP